MFETSHLFKVHCQRYTVYVDSVECRQLSITMFFYTTLKNNITEIIQYSLIDEKNRHGRIFALVHRVAKKSIYLYLNKYY